jgi:hypothetical protein
MPDFVLPFGSWPENGETKIEMPDPSTVGHAAAWAAERGYWDVATCLMELAHALADLETPVPAPAMMPEILSEAARINVPLERPELDSWLRRAVDARRVQLEGMPADAQRCKIDLEASGCVPQHTAPPSDACDCVNRADCARHNVTRCEHGYWAADNVHTATGGVCDLSAGTGV